MMTKELLKEQAVNGKHNFPLNQKDKPTLNDSK